ncbi:hypothetical protein [Legionella nagasakiensis]|uniref:hypothetical protein n=1 Tax=Legionella nagasakiensis TaxID=535290 RepID=UPI001055163E|nr:hypothetical protein [Legionella nagasakiensis]
MAYTLTLLGTDTTFSPDCAENAYDRAETLSYISTLINDTSTMPTDEVTRFRNKDVAVIDGPTTLGQEVGDRITRGVLAVLEAVSRGETDISIIAHSRGAVEAILVAHELERIQNLLKEQADFNPEVCNSVCKYTKAAMNGTHKSALETLNWSEISKHIGAVKLSMLNIDPVPGGNYVGVTHLSSLAWRDPRFYEVPKIVKEYEQFVYENERSRCFKPIVPKCVSKETKFKLQSLPGHHGTGSGNLLDQQRGVNPTAKSTEHVQELMVVKLIDFLMRNGVKITPRPPESDPFAHLMSDLFSEDLSLMSKDERFKSIYFALYNKIIENREAYLHYNKTAYPVLGQEQAILRLIWKIIDQRIVHYQAHNDTFLETIVPPVPGGHFLNYEHARIHLNHELGLADNIPLSETINTAVARLLQICRHTKQLRDLKKVEDIVSPVTESMIGDRIAPTLETEEGFDLLLQGVGTLIEEVRQSYLQNKLTDSSERKAVYHAIHTSFIEFATFNQEDPTNELAQTIFATFKSNLESTLTIKRKALKEQYQDLANNLKAKQFLIDLQDKIQKIVEHLETNKTEDNSTETELLKSLKEFIVNAKEYQAQNLLPCQIKIFLEDEFKILRELEVSGELAMNSREWACLLMVEALDNNFTHSVRNIIKEVIASCNELDKFRKALPDFKALDPSLDYEQWESELEEYRSRIVYLAAQYIVQYEIPLESIQPLFGEYEALYKQIEGFAIGLGAVNPLTRTIEKQLELIGELTSTREEQAELIRHLTADKEKQAELIRQLTADKEEQAELIRQLTADKEEQAELIRQLTADKEEQAELIRHLTADKEKQAELIRQLTADKEEQAELIRQLTADKEEQAELIRQLTADKEEQAELIRQLTADKEEQAELIRQLTADKEEQAELIRQLTADKEEQAALIKQLASEKSEQVALVKQLVGETDKQTQLIEKLSSTKQEQVELIGELSQVKERLADENDMLRQRVAVLMERLEDLQAQHSASSTDFNDDIEYQFQVIVKAKLTPLTKNYLLHLAKEIRKQVAPELDIKDFPNLVNHVQKIVEWPEDQSSQLLKQKFEAVSGLYDLLGSKNKPSEKVQQFYQQLNESDQLIQAHRDPAWKRYMTNALIVLSILTIIPGLVIFAVSSHSPKFWQSSGQTFFQNCAKELEKNAPGSEECLRFCK